jgi:uncharacterized membrane protein
MEDEGIFTLEAVLHFLHVLSAIVWFGGVITLNVLAVRIGRGPDRAAQAGLLRLSDLYGRAVLAPAGVLTLISGVWLVLDHGFGLSTVFTTLWLTWGLVGLFASVILGATLIRATHVDLRRLTEAPSDDEQRRLQSQRRAAVLYGINQLILLSVVWAMVFKPTV